MFPPATELETFLFCLAPARVTAGFVYFLFARFRRPPTRDRFWLEYHRKHPFFNFAVFYLVMFFAGALAKDTELIFGSVPPHQSIAYGYLFPLVFAIPISVFLWLQASRQRDARP